VCVEITQNQHGMRHDRQSITGFVRVLTPSGSVVHRNYVHCSVHFLAVINYDLRPNELKLTAAHLLSLLKFDATFNFEHDSPVPIEPVSS
jgi:hypothetical protein